MNLESQQPSAKTSKNSSAVILKVTEQGIQFLEVEIEIFAISEEEIKDLHLNYEHMVREYLRLLHGVPSPLPAAERMRNIRLYVAMHLASSMVMRESANFIWPLLRSWALQGVQ